MAGITSGLCHVPVACIWQASLVVPLMSQWPKTMWVLQRDHRRSGVAKDRWVEFIGNLEKKNVEVEENIHP